MKFLPRFFKLLSLSVTRTSLERAFSNYSETNLSTLVEVLRLYKIDCLPVRIPLSDLAEIPYPAIAETHKNGLVILTSLEEGKISYWDEKKGDQQVSLEEFAKNWDGVTLLVEAQEGAGEPNYKENRRAEIRQSLVRPLLILGIFLLAGRALFVAWAWESFFWLLSMGAGLGIGVLFYLKELGKDSGFVNKLCNLNKATNCEAVLSSDSARIFSWLSLSDLVVWYFGTGFLAAILASLAGILFSGVFWGLSLLALPAVAYSLYQQAFVIKAWCTLCLGVVAVLLIQGFSYFLFRYSIDFQVVPFLFVSALVLGAGLATLKPLLSLPSKLKNAQRSLAKFKYDAEIFSHLLSQGKSVIPPAEAMRVGAEDAPVQILMVSNPFCPPCAVAHEALASVQEIFREEVSVQTVWTGSEHEKDSRNEVAWYFLILAQESEEGILEKALNIWYKNKDLEKLKKQFPLKSDSTRQEIKDSHQKHYVWSNENQIQYTPTIFVNGKQLPSQYSPADLKYLIRGLIEE